MRKSKIRDISINELKSVVKESFSFREVCRKLKINSSGNQYYIVTSCIKDNNINTSHFDSHKNRRRNIKDIFVPKSNYRRNCLRRRLIKENLIPHKVCAICKLDRRWNGKKLVLHIDHINGIKDDNRLNNLRFLCPNCHSQTKTYAGRNIKPRLMV